MAQKKQSFEQSLKKLEGIVQRLESGDLSLEKSLAAFEEGIKLAKELDEALSEAEAKVSMLLEKAGGEMEEKPWPEAEGESGGDDDRGF